MYKFADGGFPTIGRKRTSGQPIRPMVCGFSTALRPAMRSWRGLRVAVAVQTDVALTGGATH
jgi:hypothetical protein